MLGKQAKGPKTGPGVASQADTAEFPDNLVIWFLSQQQVVKGRGALTTGVEESWLIQLHDQGGSKQNWKQTENS